jgi:hypothetical protein
MFFFAFCISLSLFSCDKPNQLENSTWIGKCNFYLVGDDFIGTSYSGLYGTVSINFSIKEATVEVTIDGYLGDGSPLTAKGKGSYVCDNNKITLGIEWKENWIDSKEGVRWEGTIKKNKMTLTISGEKIEFDKVF